MGFCGCSKFCCALFCVHSSFAIVLMGKRAGCFALFVFLVSHDCVCLFLTMPGVCVQLVIVVFPGHTHFFNNRRINRHE